MGQSIEEKYREQERKIGLLSKGLVDAIWVVDPETMKITYTSDTMEKLYGYSAEEMMNFTIQDLVTPESFQIVLNTLMEGLDEYEKNPDLKKIIEVEFNHKDGNTVWSEITARLAKDQDGSLKAIGVTKDISNRKFRELEKEKLINELSRSLEEQKRLRRENKILWGLLPICADCKKIRDENGDWWPVEEYIASRSEAEFTHTICPDCKEKTMEAIKKMRKTR